MRYRLTFFTILILSLIFGLTSNGWTQKLERLAVLDLEAKWGVEDGFAEALSVIVRDEIHLQKKYSVLSQADLRAVMSRDQILQAMGGCEDTSSCLNDFGKLLGTRYMVAGAVAKIGETWTISLRLLDTVGADAGVLDRMSESRQCNENELIDLVKDVSARLLGGKSRSRVALSPEEEQAKLIADHRQKEKGESSANIQSKKSQLTINTFPSVAKIQIINIKAPYRPGMELDPGRYLLDVTAKGYKEVEKWIELPPGKNHSITMRLEQEKKTGKEHFIDPVTGMKFVGVPQGCFEMGDGLGEGDRDEHPVHEVCLGAYWIGQFEVTQEQWKMVMGDNPSLFKRGDQYPVESVSWDDSQEFLKRLNRTSGRNFRLPTEAEWEYAARGGGQKVRFGTGKDIISSEDANYNSKTGHSEAYSVSGDYRKRTMPVGSFLPNSLGLYDMSGNVWEWCYDWHGKDYYGKSIRNNPMGPESGHDRVTRGGGWNSDPSYLRATNRSEATSGLANSFLGFRVVLPKKMSNIDNY